jgi:hypothetical protein
MKNYSIAQNCLKNKLECGKTTNAIKSIETEMVPSSQALAYGIVTVFCQK